MENLERWKFYMRDIISPDSFIEMGFFWMIAAALQRRVYVGSEERPLFPNLYVLLVGDASVGKGLVIRPLIDILGYYKLREMNKIKDEGDETENALRIADANEYEKLIASFSHDKKKQMDLEEDPRYLFPIAADSATFEALLQEHSAAIRIFHCRVDQDPNHPWFRNRMYSHCSLNAVLEELSTLFRKHTEDIVNYFLKAYDCFDYRRKTKHQGTDYIKKPCLNLLAGTTPDFIRSTFDDKLLNEGFASRSVVVFEEANRFNRFDFSNVSDDQLKAKAALVVWLRKVYRRFGRVGWTPEAFDFARYYFEEVLPFQKVNESSKLKGYYGRKAAHFKKLSMAVHFSRSDTMTLELIDCEYALNLLNKLEIKMDKALVVGGRNVAGSLTNKIITFLRKRGASNFTLIWGEFINDLGKEEMLEILNYLIDSEQIEKVMDENKRMVKYAIKKTK